MKQQTPIPPPKKKIKDEAEQKPKRAIFTSLILEEWVGGGTTFSSILFKIVGYDNIVVVLCAAVALYKSSPFFESEDGWKT